MFGINQAPFLDTSASIKAAKRAVATLKDEGHEQARQFLFTIFDDWKNKFGNATWRDSSRKGLLTIEPIPVKEVSEAERLVSVKGKMPWNCAGNDCNNPIDLYIHLWTRYPNYINPILDRYLELFYGFLGLLILDNRNNDECKPSIVNAGQILLSIYLDLDRFEIEHHKSMVDGLAKKHGTVQISRKKGGSATAIQRKMQSEKTRDEIHNSATKLLVTNNKKDVAGIIKNRTGHSKTTIFKALQSHPSGMWKKSSAR